MEEIQGFLKDYTLLETKEVELNFFQIAGFPHYENVSSNILTFFLNNNLVLKSFLNCVPLDYDSSNDFVEYIEREVETGNNKRIDILVSTNKYIIGIENKIYSWLYNPIDEYYSFLSKLSKKEGKAFILIVLSKNKVEASTKYKNILHKEFSVEIKKCYSELLNNLGHRYFLLLTEYIANMDSLKGVYYMNNEFAKIAKIDGNLKKISQIMAEGQRLRNDLIAIAVRIIKDLHDDNKAFTNTWVWKEPNEIFGTAVFQDCFLAEEKYNFTIDVNVEVSGMEIIIFERNGRFDKKFEKILVEILPDLNEKFDFCDPEGDTRAYYKEKIELEEYDKLLFILKNIIKAFNDYVESKKYGT
jgi:hypothetical protein